MAPLNLDSLKAVLSSGNGNEAEGETLRDLLFSVVAKASRDDLNADDGEIANIQSLVAKHTGEQVEGAEIRNAAIEAARLL